MWRRALKAAEIYFLFRLRAVFPLRLGVGSIGFGIGVVVAVNGIGSAMTAGWPAFLVVEEPVGRVGAPAFSGEVPFSVSPSERWTAT